MKITIDLDRLLEDGKISENEYHRLGAFAARSIGVLAFNILVAFGVIAVSGAALALIPDPSTAIGTGADPCVILLHGLARSSSSMNKLEAQLQQRGYRTVNRDYPSRKYPVEILAPLTIDPALHECRRFGATSIHFVTHSLGGILVRQYLSRSEIPELHRVVMLGPPNHGSGAVDKLRHSPGFNKVNGPAGQQLGTGTESLPSRLGPVSFELGVIAGSSSINPVLSMLIPGVDDGKVSIESASVSGMADFIVVPVSHPFLMRDKKVIIQVMHFLKNGVFEQKRHPEL